MDMRPPGALALLVALSALASGGLIACNGSTSESKPLHAPPNFDPSLSLFVACSRTVVEGDVLGVIDAGHGRMLTTLKVTSWVKPADGMDPIAKIETADIAREGVYRRWPAGTHLRLAVDVDPSALPNWEFTPAEFDAIRQAAPQAANLDCPYGPS
jgi:hypothetical protein